MACESDVLWLRPRRDVRRIAARATRIWLVCASAFFSALVPTADAQTEYVIGAQDVLSILVPVDKELSGQYRVDLDGTITFPLIGKVKAAGLTVPAVEAAIRARLADGFFKNPQLAITVEEFKSQRIFVVGQVDKPGTYPLNGTTTLLEVLARAGPVGANASAEIIIVRPRVGQRVEGPVLPGQPEVEEVQRLDLQRLQSGELVLDTTLRDGDTIVVPRVENAFVFGQVRTPGTYPAQKGTTVLQMLALAGGLTERGTTGRLRIVRMVDGKRKEIKANVGDVVLPGDIVIALERLF
jgi:polysaccharide export outer membrane protein